MPSGTITNDALNLIRDLMKGDETDGEIKIIAVGDDDGTILPLAVTNSQLGNETFRKAITSHTAGGNGVVETMGILASDESIGTIKEWGFFGGSAAVAGTPDSGVLMYRLLSTHVKTALESIQVDSTDTVVQG